MGEWESEDETGRVDEVRPLAGSVREKTRDGSALINTRLGYCCMEGRGGKMGNTVFLWSKVMVGKLRYTERYRVRYKKLR